jgi:acyl-CoA synthetase (AMP-forming)/AMP-acid ligase II
MAFEALGIATLPFVQPTDPNIAMALRYCDLIASQEAVPGYPGPFMALSQAWTKSMFGPAKQSELILRRGPLNQLIHVFTTSGSSGAAKGIRFNREVKEARVRARLWQYGLEAKSRLLIAMPPSTSSGFFVAEAAFRVGATVLMFDHQDPERYLQQATHMIILPLHLRALCERIRSKPRQGPRCKVFVVGATLSHDMRALASATLNAEVVEAYGTTETAWLAEITESAVGEILPTVRLQVVDDAGGVLPVGAVGEIRARTPEMGLGYLDDAQTASSFRDGWYYTGDLGRMRSNGRIEVLGRRDHLMNLGGIKVSPELIEDILAPLFLARDLAACSIADAHGIEQLIIVCADPAHRLAALNEQITRVLGNNLGVISIAFVNHIPRTANGKVQRAALTHQIRQQLAHAEPSARQLDAGLP